MQVRKLLSPLVTIEQMDGNIEEMSFTNGNMVLPIHMTKGLEFDAVILWNPDEQSYRYGDEDAKLLYVAITRAMHELHIIYRDNLSGLLLG
jgi:DNA helicase-2/ATP-dependent DNA helicase PcrA